MRMVRIEKIGGVSMMLFLLVAGFLLPAIAEAQPLVTCPPEPFEEFGVKPDSEKEKADLIAALLDGGSRELTTQHQEFKKTGEHLKLKQLQQLAKARKKLLVEAIRRNPEAALFSILPRGERNDIAILTRDCVETEASVEGTLEVMVADFFHEGLSQNRYTLITEDRQSIILHPAGGLKDLLESRTKVRVKGIRIDQEVVFDGNRSLAEANDFRGGIDVIAQPGNPPVIGEQRTVFLLVNFQNTPQPSWLTTGQVNNFLTTQLAPFYAENSYNKISVTGNAFGWYTIPLNQTCSNGSVEAAAINAADRDVFFPNYSRLIVIAPYNNCGWLGISTLGKVAVATADGSVQMSTASIDSNLGTDLLVIGHELGHGFGNHHAGSLDCGDLTIAPSGCTFYQFDDAYDIMGNIRPPFHYNAPHKEFVGWFDPTNLQTITANGTYVLEPIETASTGLKALKIQRGSNATDYLYLEYRRPIGFDAETFQNSDVYQGGLLHTLFFSSNKTSLLDPTPTNDLQTVALIPGSSFTDPATMTTIAVSSATATGLTVDVTLGKTDFTPPTVAIVSPLNGDTVSGTIVVAAEASDPSDVEKVEFYWNAGGLATLFATAVSAPYQASLNTTQMPNGSNNVYAKAYDRSGGPGVPGNVGLSAIVMLAIANTDPNPPRVALSSPAAAAVVASPVTVSALASDDVGVYGVEFWKDADTFPFAIDRQAPYTATVSLPDGSHTFSAKARDFAGNIATSPAITVTVDNSFLGIYESSPPNGYIDPLEDRDATTGALYGVKDVSITFSAPVKDATSGGALTPSNFTLGFTRNSASATDLQTGQVPTISSVTANSTASYTLHLSSRIPLGAWTKITAVSVFDSNNTPISPTANRIVLGFLPMEVTQDGRVLGEDINRWLAIKNGSYVPPAPLTPVNFCDQTRDGSVLGNDITRAVQLINGTPGTTLRAWSGFDMGAKP